ncbi:hypothetical protein HTZ97_12775 [Desulfuromonas acetoxidans]|uniref:hypothetical protein n=1 Tax=Desulfuromonas acetoxidans TaxID=891 RepID=UPI0012DD24D4|nr:hypothetical protein [Desulfuromonas acetoxidans]MBF0644727.1 hypothetical protein [Desulfuromonas acetoxidans]NVD25272.1 hypothetical protein [Desulfuromonas acetoxidans]NVE17324.1 hypothetical protein [Desulfuromonas acetoxidans]
MSNPLRTSPQVKSLNVLPLPILNQLASILPIFLIQPKGVADYRHRTAYEKGDLLRLNSFHLARNQLSSTKSAALPFQVTLSQQR